MHSALAIATRPYIWREVHIAPFVRAVFLSLFYQEGPDDILPYVVTAIPLFKSLRAVCLGTFQDYSHPRVPEDLAKVIREHHRIDTLSLLPMNQCAALVEENSSKEYSLELEYCDENSTALLFLRINCDLEKKFAPNIWDTLEHLAVQDHRDPVHQELRASLQKFRDEGRRPALKSLNLSEVYLDRLSSWLTVVRNLDLDAFTYVPYTRPDIDVLRQILEKFPNVKRLSLGLPRLEHLTLTVTIPDHLENGVEESAAELAQPAAEVLGQDCPSLRSATLVLEWEQMHMECGDPVVVEYVIHRNRGKLDLPSSSDEVGADNRGELEANSLADVFRQSPSKEFMLYFDTLRQLDMLPLNHRIIQRFG
ncbi:hypothetical protein C8R44DRAFT_734637 [Mycena epipterygia]|nr:hypothetical protein C8R44DRAFT_734637 [Mycena epipterygia]